MSILKYIAHNHLIYFKLYSMLKPNEIMNIYYVSDILHDSIFDYITLKFKDEEWTIISQDQNLLQNHKFLYIFRNYLNWAILCEKHYLTELFIYAYKEYVDWDCISKYQILSESFIREFQDKVNWIHISYRQVLSESFIREFQDKVDWDYISINQVLSEDFIREFQDQVDWDYISENQKLSEFFIIAFNNSKFCLRILLEIFQKKYFSIQNCLTILGFY